MISVTDQSLSDLRRTYLESVKAIAAKVRDDLAVTRFGDTESMLSFHCTQSVWVKFAYLAKLVPALSSTDWENVDLELIPWATREGITSPLAYAFLYADADRLVNGDV